jgi:hypothetical protein
MKRRFADKRPLAELDFSGINEVQSRIEGFGKIEEIYFPCEIPPEIIEVVDNASAKL